jgi:hypothetical protein
MTQTTFAFIALAGVIAIWLAWGVISAFRASWRLRGVRLVTCPETGTVAAVGFSRLHAALTAVLEDRPEAQLAHCSRWPERWPCDQACVPEAQAPDAALTNLIAHWSGERRCALCAKPLAEDSLVGHHVTLRSGDGSMTEWPRVAPETLPEALRASEPVCWNCHIAETFRRQHPELVVDR